MTTCRKLTLTRMIATSLLGAGMLASAPVAAQDTVAVDCLSSLAGAELAAPITNDALNRAGFGAKASQEQNMEMYAAITVCAGKHEIPDAHMRDYVMTTIAVMVGGELRRRMVDAGMDMGPIELLANTYAENPNMEVDAYIDARPETFEWPMEAVAAANGISIEELAAWMGMYVAMRAQQLNYKAPA